VSGYVSYNHEQHRYYKGSTTYISATQLVGLVENEFDTDYHAAQVAEKRGGTPEYWKQLWKKQNRSSLEIGEELHSREEDLILSSGIDHMYARTKVHNTNYMEQFWSPYMLSWPNGVYPELKLWNDQYQVAGRADKVILGTAGRDRYAMIDDHKTNQRIRTKSFYNELTGYQMLKYPLQHLMDCEFYTYALQLSIYMFMLEEMGFYPGRMRILHYPPLPLGLGKPGERDKHPTIYELPYLRKEVVTLLNHYLCQKT
jgi:hypothetical protein